MLLPSRFSLMAPGSLGSYAVSGECKTSVRSGQQEEDDASGPTRLAGTLMLCRLDMREIASLLHALRVTRVSAPPPTARALYSPPANMDTNTRSTGRAIECSCLPQVERISEIRNWALLPSACGI